MVADEFSIDTVKGSKKALNIDLMVRTETCNRVCQTCPPGWLLLLIEISFSLFLSRIHLREMLKVDTPVPILHLTGLPGLC
jgi:hypothetical protein